MKATLLVPSKQPCTRKLILLFEFEIHLAIFLFPVTKFELLVTRTFFDFPEKFELSGVDCSHHNLCNLRNRPLEPAANEAHVGNPRLQAISSSLPRTLIRSTAYLSYPPYSRSVGRVGENPRNEVVASVDGKISPYLFRVF